MRRAILLAISRDEIVRRFMKDVGEVANTLIPVTNPYYERSLYKDEYHPQAALQLLRKEGVEPIKAQNQTFDPNWHEAVATVGRNGTTVQSDTVVNVVQTGYRAGDKLLRPAKVIVAV